MYFQQIYASSSLKWILCTFWSFEIKFVQNYSVISLFLGESPNPSPMTRKKLNSSKNHIKPPCELFSFNLSVRLPEKVHLFLLSFQHLVILSHPIECHRVITIRIVPVKTVIRLCPIVWIPACFLSLSVLTRALQL